MSHSVSQHLVVSAAEYDVEIRRFIPRYEVMLEEALGALEEQLPLGASTVLDLGAGTGALSGRIAERFEDLQLILLDADPKMLEVASVRLARHASRIELREGSFTDALPSADAAVASLALHHLHEHGDKVRVYRNILEALGPGGVLVNADAVMPAAPELRDPLMRRWAAHLVANGDTVAQAYARFAQWAIEDRYFAIDQELEMLKDAGFEKLDVRWRAGPTSVIVAKRP